MNTPPRLVAMDLDGTLVAPGDHISPDTIAALSRLAEKGVLFTTASGRDLTQQLPLFEKYGLGASQPWPHFLMTNELLLYKAVNPKSQGGWPLRSGQTPPSAWAPIEPHNETHLAHWHLHADEAIEIVNDVVARLKLSGLAVERASADAFVWDRALIDFYLYGTKEAQRAYEVLKQATEDNSELRPNCVQGGAGKYHLQITPVKGGKGYALLALAQHLGIDPHDVLAVGDSGNDEDMLAPHRPFRTATLANGDPHIKELVAEGGGYVAKASVAEGLLEVLAHHGLNEI